MEINSPFFFVSLLLLLPCPMDCGLPNIAPYTNTDRSSLLALKSHITSDPHYLLAKNWTTQTSVCNWIGVVCDHLHKRVIELNISGMGLVGSIPPEIGNLSSLVSLDMNDNSFHGEIPPSIFNISSLQVLTLRSNGLSSTLPTDMCRYGLHNLKILEISYNNLYGEIPSSLGQCSKLQRLILFSNNLYGEIPSSLGQCSKLQLLSLYRNNLYGEIPSSLGQCSKLEFLSLANNNLSGEVPREIGNLTQLTKLYLSFNSLSETNPLSHSLLIATALPPSAAYHTPPPAVSHRRTLGPSSHTILSHSPTAAVNRSSLSHHCHRPFFALPQPTMEVQFVDLETAKNAKILPHCSVDFL